MMKTMMKNVESRDCVIKTQSKITGNLGITNMEYDFDDDINKFDKTKLIWCYYYNN